MFNFLFRMDEQKYPVDVSVEYPEHSARKLAFATVFFLFPKLILVIPHMIVMWFLGIALFVAAILAQFSVLFTGTYPRVFFDFVVGVCRWQMRVNAYIRGLTDTYPPFRLGK